MTETTPESQPADVEAARVPVAANTAAAAAPAKREAAAKGVAAEALPLSAGQRARLASLLAVAQPITAPTANPMPDGHGAATASDGPKAKGKCDAGVAQPLTTQDDAYFVALLGLFTLSRLSELGYGSATTLRQHITDGRLPACKFWGRYWLRLAEAGAAAGKAPGDVDDSVAGALVQLDAALVGLTKRQRARIASLLGGASG